MKPTKRFQKLLNDVAKLADQYETDCNNNKILSIRVKDWSSKTRTKGFQWNGEKFI